MSEDKSHFGAPESGGPGYGPAHLAAGMVGDKSYRIYGLSCSSGSY